MMRKMIPAALLVVVLLFTLSACKEEQSVTNEKGELLVYQDYEIPTDGFYIHNIKEDTFSPVFHGFSGYSGMPSSTDISDSSTENGEAQVRSLWISDQQIDPEDFILDVDNKKTELVMWQTSEGDMPEAYYIEKYKKLGYTVGAYFTFGDTGNTLYINNKEHCEDSDAESVLGSFSSEMLRISRLNKDSKLPLENVDKEVSMLLGLEKDKKYQIGLFDGTQYKDVDVLADTLCFKSQKITELTSPYNVTEKNYFVINLPKNLTRGYYYINDAGMFRYTGETEEDAKRQTTETSGEKQDGSAAQTGTEGQEEDKPSDTENTTEETMENEMTQIPGEEDGSFVQKILNSIPFIGKDK